MSNTLSFNHLFSLGNIIKETDSIEHRHAFDFLSLYDGNYITFKQPPSFEEFIQVESYLKDFHLSNKQDHLKFKFPESFTFSKEFKAYLIKEKYTIDTLELFLLNKSLFPSISNNHAIIIKTVDKSNLVDLLDLRFQINNIHGEEYALRKNKLIEEFFINQKMIYLIAYDNGIPVGCLNVIEKNHTLEIDDLYVNEDFRHKKIASLLQEKTIELAKEKDIILLADGNDTPRNMYLKQGYSLLQTRYDIFKQF